MTRHPVSESQAAAWAALALTAACIAVVVLDLRSPIRVAVAGAFLLLAPGAGVLSALPPLPWSAWAPTVVAVSIAVDVVLSLSLFYLGWWTTTSALACLAVVTAGAAAWRLVVLPRRQPADGQLR